MSLAPAHGLRNRIVGTARSPRAQAIAGGFALQATLVVSGVIAARALGVEDRGHLALLMLVPIILVQLGSMGLPLAVTFYLASGRQSLREEYLLLRRIAALQAAGITVLTVGLYLLVLDWRVDSIRTAVLLVLVVPIFALLHAYGLAGLQGQQRFLAFNVCRWLPSVVYTAWVVATYLIGVADLTSIAAGWALSTVTIAVATVWVASKGSTSKRTKRPARVSVGEQLRFGLRGLLGSASPIQNLQLDQAVVGLLLSPAVLGIYVVGVAFTNLSRFVSQSIGLTAFPNVAAASDPRAARKLLWSYFRLVLLVCGLITVALELALGELVPLLFGDQFREAIEVGRLLLVASLVFGLCRVLTDAARGEGRPLLGTITELIAFSVMLPVAIVVAPESGASGVALAGICGYAAALVFVTVSLARHKPTTRATTQGQAGLADDAGFVPEPSPSP